MDLMPRLLHGLVWLDEGLQARLRARGLPNVSRAQSMVMIHITSGTRRPSEIARRLGVSRQAIHATIGQMGEMGILQLVPDPADGRNRLVELTPFGEEMRHAAHVAMQDILSALAERIGNDGITDLLRILRSDWGPTV
ncbi:MAG: winged helix-turn-helix transcriptional regulator [Sphingomonadales bacterium]|nr:winged helix-turn-helix transcriptional regulator [Sphingomonadales bacterium]MDE2569720.1 winged helix-turn-helix transcriptional regulator [Sphingomonadales bacterium]